MVLETFECIYTQDSSNLDAKEYNLCTGLTLSYYLSLSLVLFIIYAWKVKETQIFSYSFLIVSLCSGLAIQKCGYENASSWLLQTRICFTIVLVFMVIIVLEKFRRGLSAKSFHPRIQILFWEDTEPGKDKKPNSFAKNLLKINYIIFYLSCISLLVLGGFEVFLAVWIGFGKEYLFDINC